MKKGFTLLEMLLSMSLITGMLGVVLVNYRQANNQRTVQVAVDNFRQTMDTAKSNAMNGKKDCTVCGGSDSKCNNSVDDKPLEGWAVGVTSTSYSLFGLCGTAGSYSKFPAVVPTVSLPQGVTMTYSGTPLPTIGAFGSALEFKPLGQGTNLPENTNATFTVTGTGGSGQVQVTDDAQIGSSIVVTPPVSTPVPTAVPTAAPTATPTPVPTAVPTAVPCVNFGMTCGGVYLCCPGNGSCVSGRCCQTATTICNPTQNYCCAGTTCKLSTGNKYRCAY